MNPSKILARMVRLGKVTVLDPDQKTARVKFLDSGTISDWLFILRQGGARWVPKLNDNVLVLFLPGENSDGFILGTW